VFLLHLYDRRTSECRRLAAVGYTKDTAEPPGGQIVRDARGTPVGLLLAKPNAGILYATLAKGPKLPFEYQLNSTRQFMRELNRLGVTAPSTRWGFQNYPDDYAVAPTLDQERQLTIRPRLPTSHPEAEGGRSKTSSLGENLDVSTGSDYFRHNRAGEMLVLFCADSKISQPRRTCRLRWNATRGRGAYSGQNRCAVAPARNVRRDDQPQRRRLRGDRAGHPLT